MNQLRNQQAEKKERRVIKPVFDRMLLEPISFVRKSGGLHVPDDLTKSPVTICRVLAVGPGKLNAETNEYLRMAVRSGDLVYANIMLGNKITPPMNVELVVRQEGGGEFVLEANKEYILQNEDTIYAHLE